MCCIRYYFLMTSEEEWLIGSYHKDIHNYLRLKERKRFIYRGQSPQLHLRKSMIEWMNMICLKMEFCTSVQHLAVYLLDIFMDNHTIYDDHLRMVIIGCLMVAVKLEEKDNLIPRNSDFNSLLGNKYKLIEFVSMEISILNFFNWDILFPTAAHFARYYSFYSFHQSDNMGDNPLQKCEHSRIYFWKYVDYFLGVSLLDPAFINFTPSLVAASCIASTRICLTITPCWSKHLENLTNYKYPQLKPYVEMLLNALDTDLSTSESHCSEINGNSTPVSTKCIAIT
ncbi:cyclin-J [Nephila pilipes]|uniref:Cyclin-J n=1 Tax=Nephila pilipes TaxID=299642 RepID=A0A8X6T3B3_NEPPI|nr:cyclin-J [Nephila pilipes]GFS76773.1 cyclin-J [Nephila pilipes]GFT21166.1 cyclin-J [Nephila pilipes]GFU40950.1 cyclin-J [Nephila pilipes]